MDAVAEAIVLVKGFEREVLIMRRKLIMKMKVKRDALKKAIEKHVAKGIVQYEKEKTAYGGQLAVARSRYIQNVVKYQKELRNGGEPRHSYELSNWLDRGVKWPSEPKEPDRHVDLLVKLDLAEDQILVVDDHSDYMKFLSGKCVCR